MVTRNTPGKKLSVSSVKYILGVQDMPSVSMEVAAWFFGWSRERFKARFDECFHQYIRHYRGRIGLRLVLIDVIRVAWPELDDELAHRVAIEYVLEYGTAGGTQRSRQKARRGKNEKEEKVLEED